MVKRKSKPKRSKIDFWGSAKREKIKWHPITNSKYKKVKKKSKSYPQARRFGINPFMDSDRDKYPNFLDCRPYNRKKQHIYLSPEFRKRKGYRREQTEAYVLPTRDDHIYISDASSAKGVKTVAAIIGHEEQHKAILKLIPGKEGVIASHKIDLLVIPSVFKDGGKKEKLITKKSAGKLYGPKTAARGHKKVLERYYDDPEDRELAGAFVEMKREEMSGKTFNEDAEPYKKSVALHKRHRELESLRAKGIVVKRKFEENPERREEDWKKIDKEAEEETQLNGEEENGEEENGEEEN